MNERDLVIQLLQSKPVAYLPDLAKAIGSVKAGLFLSQILWWSQYSEDGWVYRTQTEIYEETGLSEKEQRNARKLLKKLGLIEEERRGVPPRWFYKINVEALLSLLKEYYENRKNHQLPQTCPKGRFKPAQREDLNLPKGKVQTCPKGQSGEPSNGCSSTTSDAPIMRYINENKKINTINRSSSNEDESLSHESDLKENFSSLEDKDSPKTCLSTSHTNSSSADGSAVRRKTETPTNQEKGVEKVRRKSKSSTNHEDPVVKELAKKLSAMFYHTLKEEGVPYRDYGKLMKIAKKFGAYGKYLIEKEGWDEEKVLFFGAMCVAYYLSRNNPRPEAIYGMPAENLTILKKLKNEKPSYFELLKTKANQILDALSVKQIEGGET